MTKKTAVTAVMTALICFAFLISVIAAVKGNEDTEEIRRKKAIEQMTKEADENLEGSYYEKDAGNFDSCSVLFRNDKVLSCALATGYIFSVGEKTDNGEHGLVLNPHTERAANEKYAYVITSSDPYLVMPETVGRENGSGASEFIFTGRDCESMVPVESNLFWRKGYYVSKASEFKTEIRFRIIRISDSTVLGTAACDIIFDGQAYGLDNLRSTDIRNTEEEFELSAKEFINRAVEFIEDGERGPQAAGKASELDRSNMVRKATIEHCLKPYHAELLDSKNRILKSEDIIHMDVVAVNVPYSGMGNVTVYFAPERQVNGFAVASTAWAPEKNYIAFGYDYPTSYFADDLPVGCRAETGA